MIQSPASSAAFERKTAVSVSGDVVHASDLGFSNKEDAPCTLYDAVELIEIIGVE
jgi:hypothetical protein